MYIYESSREYIFIHACVNAAYTPHGQIYAHGLITEKIVHNPNISEAYPKMCKVQPQAERRNKDSQNVDGKPMASGV
jgi:hypothetical protein